MNDLLHISPQGVAMVQHFEDCWLTAKPDEAGVPTIGWGETSAEGHLKVVNGMTITQAEADRLLMLSLMTHEERVKQLVTVELEQCQFDALVSFDFNTGGLMLGIASVKARFGAGMMKDQRSALLNTGAMMWHLAETMAKSPLSGASQTVPSTLLRMLNTNQPFDAAEQFGQWIHAGGEVLNGLVRRRHAERDLFCGFGWERWKD